MKPEIKIILDRQNWSSLFRGGANRIAWDTAQQGGLGSADAHSHSSTDGSRRGRSWQPRVRRFRATGGWTGQCDSPTRLHTKSNSHFTPYAGVRERYPPWSRPADFPSRAKGGMEATLSKTKPQKQVRCITHNNLAYSRYIIKRPALVSTFEVAKSRLIAKFRSSIFNTYLKNFRIDLISSLVLSITDADTAAILRI